MASLLDVASIKQTVEIRGQEVEVTGIGADGIAKLLEQFPDIRKWMGGSTQAMQDEGSKGIMENFPAMVPHILAAGTGLPGDKKAIEAARKLGVGEQMALLNKVWELTFGKGGFSNFIRLLTQLSTDVNAAADVEMPTKADAPIKDQVTK